MKHGDVVWVKAEIDYINKDGTLDVNILSKNGKYLDIVCNVPVENIETDKPLKEGKVTIEYDLDTGTSKIVGRDGDV